MQHGLPKSLHGVAVRLLKKRYPVDVEQLVVGLQSFVSRSGATVYDALYEDPQVLIAARFALDADAEAGFFGVMYGDVES